MLIAVNVGNSVISVGFFENYDYELLSSFKLSSDVKKTSDEYLASIKSICAVKGIDIQTLNAAIISSVVPQLTNKIKDTVSQICKNEPLLVGPGVKTGFRIKIDNPSELGGDIVANAAAISYSNQNSSQCTVFADIGTVNTVSAINESGDYLGCAIFPGVQMSLETLHGNTAQLPNTNVLSNVKSIGKNSQSAICAGVLMGNAYALDGFVESFAREMKCATNDLKLVATGEFAPSVIKKSRYNFEYEEELTLKGLYCIYKNTTK